MADGQFLLALTLLGIGLLAILAVLWILAPLAIFRTARRADAIHQQLEVMLQFLSRIEAHMAREQRPGTAPPPSR